MFEARFSHAGLFKKVIDAIGELINQANFSCTRGGMECQSMDQSHTAMVSLLLRADRFDHYRCNRNLTLGIDIGSLAKILRSVANDDSVTIKAEHGGDSVEFAFENNSMTTAPFHVYVTKSLHRRTRHNVTVFFKIVEH
jgi:proliferating cell nuclear antigen